ncbi:MAG: DUF4129 domain-containing protein [Candidatus Limnocylindrales bacterium]
MIGRSQALRGRIPDALAELAGPALIAVAEGAWIGVVYLLFETAGHAGRPLSPLVFAVAAGVGMVVGVRMRAGPPRLGLVAAGLIAIALLGWLLVDGSVDRLLAGDATGMLALNPGGFLLGIAALRGVYRGQALADIGGSDLGLGAPAVAVGMAWLIGGALAEPARSTFAAEAIWPTVLFVAIAPAANAVSRVAGLADRGGFTWTGNRTWIGLLGAGILVVAGAALYSTTTALAALGGIGPWIVVGLIAIVIAREPSPTGRPGTGRRSAVAWLILLAVIAVILLLPQSRPVQDTTQGTTTVVEQDTDASGRAGGSVLIVAGLAIGAVVVVLMLRRRRVSPPGSRAEADDDRETSVDWGRSIGGWRWRPSFGSRHRPPSDAVAAYRAALAELATDSSTRRQPGETPQVHARRLRGDGTGSLDLELLAADYGLVRYAGRSLSGVEDRRALGRYQRIRDAVLSRAAAMRLEALAGPARGGEPGTAGQEEAKDTATASRDGRV